MRRIMAMLAALCLAVATVAAEERMLLAQALARLNATQTRWTITFVEEELEGMMTEGATATDSIPEAVARLTRGLPVRLKTRGRQIYVQRDKARGRALFMLHGHVYDSRTHNEVPGCVVELMSRDSIVLARRVARSYWQSGEAHGYSSYFSLDLPREQGTYILRLSHEDYDTTFVNYTLSNLGRREYSRELPPLYLSRPIRHTMKEVTVTASKVMFYHRGDKRRRERHA